MTTSTIVRVKVKRVKDVTRVLKVRWKNQTMTLAQTGPRAVKVHRRPLVLWFCDECQASAGLLLNLSAMNSSLEAPQGE